MSCAGTSSCTCGCCSGISVQTPQGEFNRAGLPIINYRTGTWAQFKESMLARLSSSDYPALAHLTTRDDDDFSIALLDASAVVLDILTFYQERLANESYLRTATQMRSLVELCRLINYQPAPGVSAATYLEFTLQAVIGQPANPNTPAITIPQGTQVQSVPVQGQTPQIFETSANILAKPDWNALPVQAGTPWQPGPPCVLSLYLQGVSNQLNPGDALLILGINRESWVGSSGEDPSTDWDIVILNQVTPNKVRNITYVAWDAPLPHEDASVSGFTAGSQVKVFALRQKAALFGNTAPKAALFTKAKAPLETTFPTLINTRLSPWQWRHYYVKSSNAIDLDSTYSKIVVGSWFALINASAGVGLYKAAAVSTISRSDFGISAKVTELSTSYSDPALNSGWKNSFDIPNTAVVGQCEQLALAETPLTYPLYNTTIDLQDLRPDLANIGAIAMSGNAQKIAVTTAAARAGVSFTPDNSTTAVTLNPGDILTIVGSTGLPPYTTQGSFPDWGSSTGASTVRVADSSGRTGTLVAPLCYFTLALAASPDPVIQEFALVSSVVPATEPYPHTQIILQTPLANCYDRTTATVNTNVAPADNGQTVSEVLGSGSVSTPNQRFTLKQSPLTFVQSGATPSGRLSTLQITANTVNWTEVPTLYEQPPSATVFATLNQPGGVATAFFGDGAEGATLPTGQNNIQAKYRTGSGLAGNVAAGAITTLIDRPTAVTAVTNPQVATGGQDAQAPDDIRANAPLSVLTLGRAVSVTDHQNFAATFGGIAKANAIWIPSGPGRGVFITIAAAGGVAVQPGQKPITTLTTALQSFGNPLIPINVVTFLETIFSISADVAYDPAYDSPAVHAAIVASLTQSFSFAARTFGQGVSADEVAAFIQAVPGVVAVNVTNLGIVATSAAGDINSGNYSVAAFQQWNANPIQLPRPSSGSKLRICPYIPVATPDALPPGAEILVLDPDPASLSLGTLT